MRSRFRSDRRLTVRMTVTMFLLGLLYVAFFAALIVLLKSWLLVVALIAVMFVAQFWFSDRIAMFAMIASARRQSAKDGLNEVAIGCDRWMCQQFFGMLIKSA